MHNQAAPGKLPRTRLALLAFLLFLNAWLSIWPATLNLAGQALAEESQLLPQQPTLDRALPAKTILNGQIERKTTMSAEQFRQLEYGVIGLDAVVFLNGSGPIVSAVYPTCPAANAGIQPGDLIVRANDHIFQPGDGQRVMWQVVGGKAATPVDLTVLRHRRLLTFHLLRMNIEDIEDDQIRSTYEFLLSQLGPPQQ